MSNNAFSIYNFDGEQVSRVFEGSRKRVSDAFDVLRRLLPKAEFAESAVIFNSETQKEIRLIGSTGYPVYFMSHTESVYYLAHHCDNKLSISVSDSDETEEIEYMHEISYHTISLDKDGIVQSQRELEANHPEDFEERFFHPGYDTKFKPGDLIVEIWTYYDHSMNVILLRSDFSGEHEVWG